MSHHAADACAHVDARGGVDHEMRNGNTVVNDDDADGDE